MSFETIVIKTRDEGLVDITSVLQSAVKEKYPNFSSGILFLHLPHTSCALTINEGYDPDARIDMENFLQHLAPRNLGFITHTAEGPDDSPSHMKSILLNSGLQIFVEDGKFVLGQWQAVYLAEFRDGPHDRKIYLKAIED